jgi:sec-independent protein translocase protein TatC
MTLVEHLYELRSRLFKASLGILVGMVVGVYFSEQILEFLIRPYSQALHAIGLQPKKPIQLGPVDYLILELKVGLYTGLILASPVWLYQLWAFITPGLHKHERRWAYGFVAVAAPLFTAGAGLAYFVVATGLEFLLAGSGAAAETTLELTRYIDFVTGMMLLFGIGLEFPLVVMMLNLVGLVSAQRLLSWWRVAVFLTFVFAAVVTPTPDPFGMIALALPMCLLYFAAVGVAFLNDRRKARSSAYAGLGDDETSPLDDRLEPVEPAEPVEGPRRRAYDTDDLQ